MPNQLAASKKRQSLAEHAVVLAALEAIAHHEDTSVMALLRKAARKVVREKVKDPEIAQLVAAVAKAKTPPFPSSIQRASQLARYKRALREYDAVMMEIGLQNATEIQQANSIAPSPEAVKLVGLA